MAQKKRPLKQSRDDKRAQFEHAGRRSPLVWAVPLAIVAVAIVATVVLVTRGGTDSTTTATAAAPAQPAASGASGGDGISVAAAEVSDGQIHFYSTDIDGTTVKYFAGKASDGTIRTALDACQVCYQAKRGYTQQGDVVVCNNCGRTFPIDQIGVQRGGCNPIPIGSKAKGDRLVIDSGDLAGGVQYFQ